VSRGKARAGAWRLDPGLRAAVEQGVDAVLVEAVAELPDLDDPEEVARRVAKLRERLERQRTIIGRKRAADRQRAENAGKERTKIVAGWASTLLDAYAAERSLVDSDKQAVENLMRRYTKSESSIRRWLRQARKESTVT
jgi:hypothetical protein